MLYNVDFNCIRYIILLEARFPFIKKVYAYLSNGYIINIYVQLKKKKKLQEQLPIIENYCNRKDVRPITSVIKVFPFHQKPEDFIQDIDFTSYIDRAKIGNFPNKSNVEKTLIRNIKELDIVNVTGPIGKNHDQQIEYKCYSNVNDLLTVEQKIEQEFSKILTPKQYGSLIIINNKNLNAKQIDKKLPFLGMYPHSEKVDEYIKDPIIKTIARKDYELFLDNMHDVSLGIKKASNVIDKEVHKKSSIYIPS